MKNQIVHYYQYSIRQRILNVRLLDLEICGFAVGAEILCVGEIVVGRRRRRRHATAAAAKVQPVGTPVGQIDYLVVRGQLTTAGGFLLRVGRQSGHIRGRDGRDVANVVAVIAGARQRQLHRRDVADTPKEGTGAEVFSHGAAVQFPMLDRIECRAEHPTLKKNKSAR